MFVLREHLPGEPSPAYYPFSTYVEACRSHEGAVRLIGCGSDRAHDQIWRCVAGGAWLVASSPRGCDVMDKQTAVSTLSRQNEYVKGRWDVDMAVVVV